MKRFSVLFISILTVALTFYLAACDAGSSSSSGGCGSGTTTSSSSSSGSSGSWVYATTTLQAENATIVSGKAESEHSGYTGSGYANTDNGIGNYIEFALNAARATSHKLTFYYALESGNRYGSIQVNGSTQVSNIDFDATGAWTTWATASAKVTLSAGANTIRVTAEQSGGLPNIDKMDVYGFGVSD